MRNIFIDAIRWYTHRTRTAFIHVNSTQSSPNFTCGSEPTHTAFAYGISVLYGSLRLRANCMLSLLRFQFSFRLDLSNLLLKTSQRLLCCYAKPIHALRIAAKRISTKWADSGKNQNRFFFSPHSLSMCPCHCHCFINKYKKKKSFSSAMVIILLLVCFGFLSILLLLAIGIDCDCCVPRFRQMKRKTQIVGICSHHAFCTVAFLLFHFRLSNTSCSR